MEKLINDIDWNALRTEVLNAEPFPHFCIDNFLTDELAEEVYASFPSYEDALTMGKKFKAVNEKRKIQITDATLFPPAIKKLNELLASKEFVEKLSYIADIPELVSDPELVGGGIHQTDQGGHLDVHVDFNYVEDKKLHRRLNLLLYFNKDWKEEYGGYLDLWDQQVKKRHGYFEPKFNRLCGFVTSDISYHGVTPIKCPPGVVRRSFATYYYTEQAPEGWDGRKHSTIFKPRPDEFMKGKVHMPLEKLGKRVGRLAKRVKSKLF